MSDKPGEWNEELQKYNALTGGAPDEPPGATRRVMPRKPVDDEKKEQDR